MINFFHFFCSITLVNSSYSPSWISTFLSAKSDLSSNWANLNFLDLVRSLNLSCLSYPGVRISFCGGFTLGGLLCSSPFPWTLELVEYEMMHQLGPFYLLDVGVLCWLGGYVLCLLSSLLISIFSGLLSFSSLGLFQVFWLAFSLAFYHVFVFSSFFPLDWI